MATQAVLPGRVLQLLRDRAVQGEVQNLSIRAMAKELATSTRGIQQALEKLELSGDLAITHSKYGAGKWCNVYSFPAKDEAPGAQA